MKFYDVVDFILSITIILFSFTVIATLSVLMYLLLCNPIILYKNTQIYIHNIDTIPVHKSITCIEGEWVLKE